MADYASIKQFILSWEGGYVNHKNDKGGPTNKGVTWSVWSAYARKKGFTPTISNLKAITDAQWDEIFTPNYWSPFKASKILDQNIATLLVDWGYCSGVTTVIKKVQRYLGLKADGIVGPKTLGAINDADSQYRLFAALWDLRSKFLSDIVKRNHSQEVFLTGWMNRLKHIQYGKIKPNK